jgi:Glycosyl transferase family 2
MRIFGLTVGRNEASRYLVPMLAHHLDMLDDVFFYDDQSDDETPHIVTEMNCTTRTRPNEVPSFVDSEGAFRAAAWEALEEDLMPRPGDWVLVVDCDECLVSDYGAAPGDVRDTMEKVITAAGMHAGVMLTIPEVWGWDMDLAPVIRTDGFWDTIHAPRLFPYRPGAQFFQGTQYGVPSVPSYVMAGPWFGTDLLSLMHYGYADESDQIAKYARYSGRSGHSDQHVESIISPIKQYGRWQGPFNPEMVPRWRQ